MGTQGMSKIVSYFCDVCGKQIEVGPADDVKGINLSVDLDHGKYESHIFPHACLNCRMAAAVLSEWSRATALKGKRSDERPNQCGPTEKR
jgi:hypothetical protein